MSAVVMESVLAVVFLSVASANYRTRAGGGQRPWDAHCARRRSPGRDKPRRALLDGAGRFVCSAPVCDPATRSARSAIVVAGHLFFALVTDARASRGADGTADDGTGRSADRAADRCAGDRSADRPGTGAGPLATAFDRLTGDCTCRGADEATDDGSDGPRDHGPDRSATERADAAADGFATDLTAGVLVIGDLIAGGFELRRVLAEHLPGSRRRVVGSRVVSPRLVVPGLVDRAGVVGIRCGCCRFVVRRAGSGLVVGGSTRRVVVRRTTCRRVDRAFGVDVEALLADGVGHLLRVLHASLVDLELLDDARFLPNDGSLLDDGNADRVALGRERGLVACGGPVDRGPADLDLFALERNVELLPFLDDVLRDANLARLLALLRRVERLLVAIHADAVVIANRVAVVVVPGHGNASCGGSGGRRRRPRVSGSRASAAVRRRAIPASGPSWPVCPFRHRSCSGVTRVGCLRSRPAGTKTPRPGRPVAADA